MDPDDLEDLTDISLKAGQLFEWFTALQVAGFPEGLAYGLLPPLLLGGYVLKRQR
jgi:hypothetical protein